MLESGRIPQINSQSGAQMEVSGHYYARENESFVPDMRLGGPCVCTVLI
jgi:hypothetical protein